jgi:hypothetical protein
MAMSHVLLELLKQQKLQILALQSLKKPAQLHPHAEPPAALDYTEKIPLQIHRKLLKQVLKQAPKGSAPGPSGWTLEDIQAVAFGSEQFMEAVFAFINVDVAGDMPEWNELRASRLIPLLKKGDGIRPIAIGEVWARLLSMCAMSACPIAGPSLHPLKVGFGVRGGAQCLGHAIRAAVLETSDDVTLQLDFENAFNTLSREGMLKAIAERAPQMLKYAACMYRQASPLWLAAAPNNLPTIYSKAGVRQSDPWGPLFFAITLQNALYATRSWHDDAAAVAREHAKRRDKAKNGTPECTQIRWKGRPARSATRASHTEKSCKAFDRSILELLCHGLLSCTWVRSIGPCANRF